MVPSLGKRCSSCNFRLRVECVLWLLAVTDKAVSVSTPAVPSAAPSAAPSVTGNHLQSSVTAAPSVTGNHLQSSVTAAPSVTGNRLQSSVTAAPSVTGNHPQSSVTAAPSVTDNRLQSSVTAAPSVTDNRLQSSVTPQDDLVPEIFIPDLRLLTAKHAKSDDEIIDEEDVMGSLISQMDYPVVTISRDFNNHSVILATQSRFIADITARDYGKPFNYRWTIPLIFTSSEHPTFDQTHADIHWMYKEDRTKDFNLNVPLPDCANEDGWILANVPKSDYYRVNYKTGNWLALGRQLQKDHTVIATKYRARIINHAFSLAKASYIPLDIALSTIEYLDKEREYLPWQAAWQALRYMESALSYSSLYGTFEAFMRAKLQNPIQHFSHLNMPLANEQVFFSSMVTEQACHYGIDSCTSKAAELFSRWDREPLHNQIPPNIVKAVACQAVAIGGWGAWAFVLKKYKRTTVESWKDVLLTTLACSKKPWILRRFLDMLLKTHNPLGDQNILGVITSVIQNKFGRFVAWDFYRSRYVELKAKYEVLSCTEALPAITEFFNTKLELNEVITFKRNNCSEYDENQFHNQIVAKIETNIRWLKINTPIIRSWMADRGYLVD